MVALQVRRRSDVGAVTRSSAAGESIWCRCRTEPQSSDEGSTLLSSFIIRSTPKVGRVFHGSLDRRRRTSGNHTSGQELHHGSAAGSGQGSGGIALDGMTSGSETAMSKKKPDGCDKRVWLQTRRIRSSRRANCKASASMINVAKSMSRNN